MGFPDDLGDKIEKESLAFVDGKPLGGAKSCSAKGSRTASRFGDIKLGIVVWPCSRCTCVTLARGKGGGDTLDHSTSGILLGFPSEKVK